ncbi:MAG: NADH-quinone oxidoreductase subunit C [Deltaproteobacteria bacterium]|nr:NADH-quinone oxidoreductase subunit C [Deltaproteobacteria bacterium]
MSDGTQQPIEAPRSDPAVLALLRERFPEAVLATHAYRGDATAEVAPASLLEVCTFLRDDPALAFDFLVDVTAVDYIGSVPRFEVVYHLYSLPRNHRVRLKARVPEESPRIASVTSIWRGANWLERETFDMYGIHFEGHPDLRRIYLYEEFQGHPLRKDYPKEKRQPLVTARDVAAPQAARSEARDRERYGRWQ